MRPFFLSILLLFVSWYLIGSELRADEYLGKDGRLTQKLTFTQTQGGFAGFTGVRWIVDRDGAWTLASVFNRKITPKSKGKLSKEKLAKLASILAKYELAKLPAKSGKQPGANPHILAVEYGKHKATLVGQVPPKLNAKNPASTVESRFAGIWQGVKGLLTPPASAKDE